MSLMLRANRRICYLCDKEIKTKEKIFIIQQAKTTSGSGDIIKIEKSSTGIFVVHQTCQNKLLFKKSHPDLKLEEDYYNYLTLTYSKNKPIWKLNDEKIKDNCTQEEFNILIYKLAKVLLSE